MCPLGYCQSANDPKVTHTLALGHMMYGYGYQ